jgi:RHS repeat-associated protein
MTTATICATREVSWSLSFYRGEQYDSDLGLYYLRARYYNPATGRFLSRDPEDGKAKIPSTLHKYLYANGDPVNGRDPRGRDSMLETGSLDAMIARTVPELLVFGGAVGCALGIDAYAISLLNGGNAMDNTLGGAGLLLGCATAGAGYFF